MGNVFRLLMVSALAGAPAALAAQDPIPSPSVAERIGCDLAGRMGWLRDQVAQGAPPLLVINDTPSGAIRYDPARCARMPGEPPGIVGVRVLRPSAAKELFGAEGRNGAVLVEIAERER